jgi:recombination protein RecA
VKVVKNKMAPPFREVEFDILYGQGVSRAGEVIDMGVDAGCIQKSGAWYSAGGERIGQGRDAARKYLLENPKLMTDLEQQVMATHGIGTSVAAPALDEAAEAEIAAGVDSSKSGKAPRANGAAQRRAARPN